MQVLYATNCIISESDEAHLSVSQPTLERLVSVADFRLLAVSRDGAGARAQNHRPDLWKENTTEGCSSKELQELHQKVSAAARILSEEHEWLREILFAGWAGGDHKASWEDLLVTAESLAEKAGTATRFARAYGPELPEGEPLDEIGETLRKIVAHLESGGSLGLLTKVKLPPGIA